MFFETPEPPVLFFLGAWGGFEGRPARNLNQKKISKPKTTIHRNFMFIALKQPQ
jgi:hypothetical protein